MRDYTRGAGETLNYVIRILESSEKDEAVRQITLLKDELENGAAGDFHRKLWMS